MGDLVVIAVVAVAVLVTVVKRFVGEPLDARDLFVVPLILIGIGVYSLTEVDTWSAIDVVWLPLGCVVGFCFGAVRGTTTVLFTREEVLHQRYTVRTVAVWALSLLVGFGVTIGGMAVGVHEDTRPMVLSIGVGLLGEMATTGVRALSTGKAFALKESADSSSPVDRVLSGLAAPRVRGELTASPSFREAVHTLRGRPG